MCVSSGSGICNETEKSSGKGVRFNCLYLSQLSCFANSFLLSLLEKQDGSQSKVHLFFLFLWFNRKVGNISCFQPSPKKSFVVSLYSHRSDNRWFPR